MTERHEWGPGEIIGGHRLLRRLGSGPTAEVWLAAPAVAEDGERVALKLIRPGESIDRASLEAEALWRARGPHVVRLRDAVPLASGTPFLILDAVPHELHTVLAAGITPGGAVTLLVPLAQELARLHAVGVSHGGIRLSAIGVDHRGAPILLGFGAAQSGRVDAARRLADCVAFAALALVVLTAVVESRRTEEWSRLTAWLGASLPGADGWLPDCIERCYRLADPEPVALGAAESLGDVVQAAAGDAVIGSSPAGQPATRISARMRDLRALSHALRARLPRGAGLADRADSSTPSEPGALRGVRARFWVPALVAAAGLLAVVTLPSAGSADAAVIVAPTDAEQGGPPTPWAAPTIAGPPIADAAPSPSMSPSPGATSGPSAEVVDELGGVVIVEIDGPRGPEQIVLVDGASGWEVRDYLPAGE